MIVFWWHIGLAGLAAGVFVSLGCRNDHVDRTTGWPVYSHSGGRVIGAVLALSSVVYLIFGVIARSFP